MGNWKENLEAQKARLHQVIMPTHKETALKALVRLKELQQKAYEAGKMTRQVGIGVSPDPMEDVYQNSSIPTREVEVDVPVKKAELEKKALLGTLASALGSMGGDVYVDTKHKLHDILSRNTKVTGNPASLPWYYAAVVNKVPDSFVAGYKDVDKAHTEHVNSELEKQIQEARSEFEKALAEESHGKMAAFNAFANCLAEQHVKKADGDVLNQALGGYGAVASLIGRHGYHEGKKWVEDNDARYLKLNAFKQLLRERMRNKLPLVRLKPQTMDGTENDPVTADATDNSKSE